MRFSRLVLRALDVHQLTRLAHSSVARSDLARRLAGDDERDMGAVGEYYDCLAPPRVPHKTLVPSNLHGPSIGSASSK